MELLEKITLYDILGYALPGGIALYVVKEYTMKETFSTFGIIVYVAISFLLGILISQAAAFLTEWAGKTNWFKKDIWNGVGLKVEAVSEALKNSKVIGKDEALTSEMEVWEHYINMYSDIQTDKTYSRLHNYASAAILYKNMALVSFVCAVKYGMGSKCQKLLFALAALVIFAVRWYRFEKKKRCYTINWYVEKYMKKLEND